MRSEVFFICSRYAHMICLTSGRKMTFREVRYGAERSVAKVAQAFCVAHFAILVHNKLFLPVEAENITFAIGRREQKW